MLTVVKNNHFWHSLLVVADDQQSPIARVPDEIIFSHHLLSGSSTLTQRVGSVMLSSYILMDWSPPRCPLHAQSCYLYVVRLPLLSGVPRRVSLGSRHGGVDRQSRWIKSPFVNYRMTHGTMLSWPRLYNSAPRMGSPPPHLILFTPP